MQKLRERLTLLLLALLPFHAFLVTVGTNLIERQSKAPLAALAFWKEAILFLILLIALVEFLKKPQWKPDRIDAVIVALTLLSVALAAYMHVPVHTYMLGFKYDLLPLLSFILLRRVPWSNHFMLLAQKTLMIVGAIIALYGILTLWLPQSFFTWLGYSDLHSLYDPNGALAPFQNIESIGVRRIQSTMSGPNQLGLWLLIPLSIAVFKKRWALSTILMAAIAFTFSRTAWIASAVLITMSLWTQFPAQRKMMMSWGTAIVAAVILWIALAAPEAIIRQASSSDHIRKPLQALGIMFQEPLGRGLGTAGPASNRTSDACVFLPEGSDATWAQAHPNLCVFVADHQVQPSDRACTCPLVTENWYLQIGVELGWLGMLLWMLLTAFALSRISNSEYSNTRDSVFGLFAALAVAALFLHAWEDAAIAYTVWMLLARKLSSGDAKRMSL